MRASPPDILLTNYKMLDYLLMRAQDAGLWKDNAADTLRYLVVDELHSFDGAQGADLACLIRRVKERVKTPKGHLICVGTSATLGDSRPEVTSDLADYAKRVFGESFAEDSLIGESVLTADEFLAGQVVRFFQPPEHTAKQELDPLSYSDVPQYIGAQYRLWFGGTIADWDDPAWRHELGQRLRSHSFLRNLLYILDGKSKDSLKLLDEIGKQVPAFAHSDGDYLALLFTSFMALVSQARVPTPQGSQPLVNVRYQLWLRELRRMVSKVANPPDLAFADDLKPEELKRSLPVIHCRECGITGWGGVVKDAENTLQSRPYWLLRELLRSFTTRAVRFPWNVRGGHSGLPVSQLSKHLSCQRRCRLRALRHGGRGAIDRVGVSLLGPPTCERKDCRQPRLQCLRRRKQPQHPRLAGGEPYQRSDRADFRFKLQSR